tara:strand:- start:553 stop:885 length:333 start_codon:yes stop_codon:yes gene_type:complete
MKVFSISGDEYRLLVGEVATTPALILQRKRDNGEFKNSYWYEFYNKRGDMSMRGFLLDALEWFRDALSSKYKWTSDEEEAPFEAQLIEALKGVTWNDALKQFKVSKDEHS